MKGSVEEIGAKMDALGLWGALRPFNWAVKPRGTAFPYFCTVLDGDSKPVKVRFLMLEGWQTLHDFVRTKMDHEFGYYTTPMEMPHFELVIPAADKPRVFRHDPGYMPRLLNEREREFVAKMLWEAYGLMLRVEGEKELPLKFVGEKAIFARVEQVGGVWVDEPLEIPDPRPYVEKISLSKDDVKKAKDLPLVQGEALELDFRIVSGLMTQEPRPRYVFGLLAVDAKSGEKVFDSHVSMHSDGGLKGLWESLAPQVLREFVRLGRVPSEIRLCSGRVFRMLRPLCLELPIKLSLHDSLPNLNSKIWYNTGNEKRA